MVCIGPISRFSCKVILYLCAKFGAFITKTHNFIANHPLHYYSLSSVYRCTYNMYLIIDSQSIVRVQQCQCASLTENSEIKEPESYKYHINFKTMSLYRDFRHLVTYIGRSGGNLIFPLSLNIIQCIQYSCQKTG